MYSWVINAQQQIDCCEAADVGLLAHTCRAAFIPHYPCLSLPVPLSLSLQGEALSHLVAGAGVVLLQREIPEHVNAAVAAAAAAAGVPVIQVRRGTRLLQWLRS
jgi:hypothetical protein